MIIERHRAILVIGGVDRGKSDLSISPGHKIAPSDKIHTVVETFVGETCRSYRTCNTVYSKSYLVHRSSQFES